MRDWEGSSTTGRRWKHQRIAELDEFPHIIRCDDFDGHQASDILIDIDFLWIMDQMVHAFEGQLDHIILGILGNAEQREPLRLDLIAQRQRGNLDLGPLAFEQLRNAIEEWAPLLLIELANRHGKPPLDRIAAQACSRLS